MTARPEADDHQTPETPESDDPQRRITFFRGPCKGCQACVELLPECFEWDEDMDMPCLKHDCAPESLIRQCMACCPEDCIDIEED